jgi:hypothetical protein
MWLLNGEGEGLDAPDEPVAIASDVAELLKDMRSVQLEIKHSNEKLARLEKRLRQALQSPQ